MKGADARENRDLVRERLGQSPTRAVGDGGAVNLLLG